MYLSDKQIADRYGVSRPTVWRWLKSDSTFPKPISLSPGCTRCVSMRSRPGKLHAARPERIKQYDDEKRNPARLADATGANRETTSFLKAEYADQVSHATGFKHVSAATMQVLHLACRHGLTGERAALVAPLVFGEAGA